METITKTDNELIAEFMGAEEWVFSEGQKGHSFWNKDSDGRRGWFPDGSTNKLPGEFKYHSSWDWLMPVVEKIESFDIMHSSQIYSNRCAISVFNGGGIPTYKYQETLEGASKIEATYKAVVGFIKWYNDQKK